MKKFIMITALMTCLGVCQAFAGLDYSGGYGAYYPSESPEGDKLLLARIQEAIRSDSSLSDNAKHINIFVLNGDVTLRGVVDNDEERRIIESIVRRQTGVKNIDNRLYLPTTF